MCKQERKEEDRTHHTTLSHHFTQYFIRYMVHCSFDHFPLREVRLWLFPENEIWVLPSRSPIASPMPTPLRLTAPSNFQTIHGMHRTCMFKLFLKVWLSEELLQPSNCNGFSLRCICMESYSCILCIPIQLIHSATELSTAWQCFTVNLWKWLL